jgi:zinc transporter, ZIP family
MDDHDRHNVGVAFAVVLCASGATALGAAVVFVPSLVRLANQRTLALSLSLSAGVMVYVSFVEIFDKSKRAFRNSGYEDNVAYLYATMSLFAGCAFIIVSYLYTYVCTYLCVYMRRITTYRWFD